MIDDFDDPGDLQLAGDFMNLGRAQLMFVNRSGGGGKVLIADFADGVAPAAALYLEAWGQSPVLDGWLDRDDLLLGGDFMGLGYEQVLFVNQSGGGGRV